MTDPNFYRFYECNIQCPKMKAREIRAGVMHADTYENLPLYDDFTKKVYIGTTKNVSSFSIGPDEVPELNNSLICGHFEVVSISDTTTGWYRGFIRGTSGQLSVSNLENVPINYLQRVSTMNLTTLTVDLVDLVVHVQWKVTIYNVH